MYVGLTFIANLLSQAHASKSHKSQLIRSLRIRMDAVHPVL